MSLINLIEFQALGDERGSLISLEGDINVPFAIKRIYVIYETKPSVIRGRHAHKELSQVMICISGSCDLLLDNGKTKETCRMSSTSPGVLIEGLIWRELSNFSSDCILLVIANEIYDELDYIRDYKVFEEMAKTTQ